ncbi:21566_t:CDS:2, partial [Dentiscutata erythropus]
HAIKIESLRQCITELEVEKAELEAKNSEIPELRKKLAEFEARVVEIHELRKKVADVKARNAELIKQMMEENNRRDARIEVLEKNKTDTTNRVPTLEHKHSQNDITNNNSSNFNSGADHHEKSSQSHVISENSESHEETVTKNLLRSDHVHTNTSEVSELKHDDEIDVVDTSHDPESMRSNFPK